MITTAKRLLGQGLYSPAEAALYARVRVPLLIRWVFGNSKGEAVFRAQFDRDEKTVTFRDLVQTLAVRAVRFDATRVPLGKIREAVHLAESKYDVDQPLLRDHVLLVNAHTKELFIDIPGRHLVQASGVHTNNLAMRPIVEPFLMDMEFDNSGLAYRYRPMRDGIRSVVIDPEVKFGEPYIETCGFGAWTLYDAYATEGSADAAAKSYGVDPDDVRLAVRFVDSLLTAGDVVSGKKPS